jgi:hypothetical protein
MLVQRSRCALPGSSSSRSALSALTPADRRVLPFGWVSTGNPHPRYLEEEARFVFTCGRQLADRRPPDLVQVLRGSASSPSANQRKTACPSRCSSPSTTASDSCSYLRAVSAGDWHSRCRTAGTERVRSQPESEGRGRCGRAGRASPPCWRRDRCRARGPAVGLHGTLPRAACRLRTATASGRTRSTTSSGSPTPPVGRLGRLGRPAAGRLSPGETPPGQVGRRRPCARPAA